jgi:DNA-binding transcriptional MerR regulator
MEKSSDAFRTISEVAEDLDLPQHVLRFWESRFSQIRPLKRGGGRRYYRPDDVELLRAIRQLLYGEGYTIKGVQKILKEQGVRALIALRGQTTAAPAAASDLLTPPLAAAPNQTGSDAATVEDRADLDDVPANRLMRCDLERLQTALRELLECERLLISACDQ